MGDSLLAYWRDRHGYQSFLYAIGALFAISAAVHSIAFFIYGGPWEWPVSWRKPIAFSASFAVILPSLAWVMGFLPARRRAAWILSAALGTASVFEVSLIALQQWRGVPSHFNDATDLDSGIFAAMGSFVGIIAVSIVVLTLWTLRPLDAPPSVALAIRTGMVLLLAGQALGGAIIANGVPQVGDRPIGSLNIFGEAGVMKVPHSVALHALQVLIVLAWLALFTRWDESRRTRVVGAACAGYSGLLLVSTFQTFSGLAPFDLAPFMGVLVMASTALAIGPFCVTAAALVEAMRAAPTARPGAPDSLGHLP